jgi:ABC-2 type transport system permease protein
MNIFIHELKSYRKSTIIWIIALVALVVFYLSIYPSFYNDAADVQKLLESYPEAVTRALGISMGDITSILGFYTFVFVYIVLCGAIQAMNLGLSVISKETRMKTADFLLTKPVNRTKVMTSKIMAAFVLIIITNIIYLGAAVLMSLSVKTEDFSMKIYIMISITMFFIQIIFMAMGIIISVIAPKIKSVISISLGTVFGFFIISMFGSVIGDEAVRYITPFKYFDAVYIINNASYEMSYIITAIVFVTISITASYIIYSKKDIHSV